MGLSEEPSGLPKGWWPKVKIPVLGAAIVLAGAVALWLLARRSEQKNAEWAAAVSVAPPSAPAPPAGSIVPPIGDITKVDISDLYPRIKQQAWQWSKGSHLVSIMASPVVASKVDLSAMGSEIVYQFDVAPDWVGHEQPPGHLALRVTRQGIKPGPISEAEKPRTEVASRDPLAPPVPTDPGEPNCVSDAAAKAAYASGVPATTPMKLRYDVDRILRRGVWTAKVEGHHDLDRVIDGKTCAIVVRR